MTAAPDAHRVRSLRASGFRNLVPLELAPGPRLNVIAGDNGQGKSNLLEAIHYAATLRSFRGAGTDELVATDRDEAYVSIVADARPLARTLEVGLRRGQARQPKLDGKRPRSGLAWLGVLPAVLFHPGDLALAQGGPEGRRALLDEVLSEIDPTYATTLASYVKALRSRNRLLKEEPVNRRAVTAFDGVLAAAGAILGQARDRLVSDLRPRATEVWHELFETTVPLEIAFSPRVEPTERALLDALAESLERDVLRGFTAEGPHADDVALRVKERSAKHHASQGQQRALVLALKVAELEVLAHRTGRVPILLLDDVSSELDATRNRRFFGLLARMGGQVFLTTTQAALIHVEDARTDFHVVAGRLERAP
ncbi:MAG: DNA replication/repair protein RecF [Sandaracinaceae bacterium]|nr:DNA replication/repair protein RecF [Sandaracinaceae bacterium]